jgi:hypothetical protein
VSVICFLIANISNTFFGDKILKIIANIFKIIANIFKIIANILNTFFGDKNF